jgi:predicted Rossmann-fold nucleotide-binding protein
MRQSRARADIFVHFDVLIEEGAIAPEDVELFDYVDDPVDTWNRIKAFYRLP